MNVLSTQQLLERLGNLLRGEARSHLHEHGLQPVQFEVLHYLSICNRYSDTPMSVTEYLGQTKGSVSQTLKVLEKKKLIEKTTDKEDKRVAHMSLTPTGYELVNNLLPSPLLKLASNRSSERDIASVNTSLQRLLKIMQEINNFKTFGQCSTCRHNIRHSANDYLCGLTKETLTSQEVKLICREHEPNKRMQSDAAEPRR